LHRESPLDDQMERIGGIVLVEDDLTPSEGSAAGDRQNATRVLGRHTVEQPPLHEPILERVSCV